MMEQKPILSMKFKRSWWKPNNLIRRGFHPLECVKLCRREFERCFWFARRRFVLELWSKPVAGSKQVYLYTDSFSSASTTWSVDKSRVHYFFDGMQKYLVKRLPLSSSRRYYLTMRAG